MTVRRLHWLLAVLLVASVAVALATAGGRLRHAPVSVDPMAKTLGLDSTEALHVLVYQTSNAPLDPFVGGRFDNDLHAVGSVHALAASLDADRWDVVAVVAEKASRGRALATDLERRDYVVLVDDDRYLVALPARRVRITPLRDATPSQWTPYGEAPGVTLTVAADRPEVASAVPVDAGLVTAEITTARALWIEAAIDGEVAGSGPHAAHLSLLGKQPILLLKAGRYRAAEPFRTVVPAPVDGPVTARIAFGLGGWALGSGHLALAGLRLSELEVVPGSVSDVRGRNDGRRVRAAVAVFAAGMALLLCCGWFGRRSLRGLGMESPSLLGSGLLFGYGALGVALVLSLRVFASPYPGACAFGLLFLWLALRRRVATAGAVDRGVRTSPRAPAASGLTGDGPDRRLQPLDALIALVLFSWVGVVAAIYLPLQAVAWIPHFPMPQILDLPKHLFAVGSLYDADRWPPVNPFFAGEAFAYNYGFYFPAALMAKLVGSRTAIYQTFAIAVLAIAIALPLVVLDIVRTVTASKGVQLAAVLLATWIGGLTQVRFDNEQYLGASLYNHHLIQSAIWTEEMVTYVVYVPQHAFAALCALLIAFLLTGQARTGRSDLRHLAAAGVLVVAGSFSSLLVLPYVVLSYALCGIWSLFRRFDEPDRRSTLAQRFAAFAIFTTPLALLVPFVDEARRWSGADGTLVSWPILSTQWLYVFSSLGVSAVLALFCLPAAIRGRDRTARRLAGGLGGLALLAFGGMLVGGRHADAGIKAALVLRLTLVPLAVLGLQYLLSLGRNTGRHWFGAETVAALMGAVLVVNAPTTGWFLAQSWRPLGAENRLFADYVRRLPKDARIVMFSVDQAAVAPLGRPVDFDFAPRRADSYLPPDARPRVQAFWTGFADGTPDAIAMLRARYDVAIAPLGNEADRRLSGLFARTMVLDGYAIYDVHAAGPAS